MVPPVGLGTAPHRFYATSKRGGEGKISSSSISVKDSGKGGKHALFDPNVKVLFTTFNLSSPITYIIAKSQIASR
jgi:6-phosphogluconolactonase (cycloisomerase 2 family)